jgi:hypothetical protein
VTWFLAFGALLSFGIASPVLLAIRPYVVFLPR